MLRVVTQQRRNASRDAPMHRLGTETGTRSVLTDVFSSVRECCHSKNSEKEPPAMGNHGVEEDSGGQGNGYCPGRGLMSFLILAMAASRDKLKVKEILYYDHTFIERA
jgi:hypothetical protein